MFSVDAEVDIEEVYAEHSSPTSSNSNSNSNNNNNIHLEKPFYRKSENLSATFCFVKRKAVKSKMSAKI